MNRHMTRYILSEELSTLPFFRSFRTATKEKGRLWNMLLSISSFESCSD